jgi:hypothetical protein
MQKLGISDYARRETARAGDAKGTMAYDNLPPELDFKLVSSDRGVVITSPQLPELLAGGHTVGEALSALPEAVAAVNAFRGQEKGNTAAASRDQSAHGR